jgi:hypothetical protein
MPPFAVLISKISAGELGVQADILEERLTRIFQLAHHWHAVLLLDEAELYLEQRVRQDIARNSLVAVFIRNLEYCKGVLFLTSNRLSEFDEAVCSRVHLFMKYNNLEDWARRDVWTTFINRANTVGGPPSLSAAEMDRLVAFVSNGRQVRLTCIAAFNTKASIADQKLCSTRPYSRDRRRGSIGHISHQNSCQGQRILHSRSES